MGEGVVVVDASGRFVLVNPMAVRLLGSVPAEIPLSRWKDARGLYLPDQTTPFPYERLPLVRALQGESVEREEMFLRNAARPEGAWLLVSAQPVRDASGAPQGAVAVFGEVTALKQAQEALEESERRLRAILDNAPAVFFLLDPKERYILVNRQWEHLYHRSRHDAAGKSAYDIFPRDIADGFHALSRSVAQSLAPLEHEERIALDGDVRTHITQKFPLFDSTGALYAICGISTDITERKRMEVSQRFLAEASRELVTSLDYEVSLQRVAELTVPTLADLCIVFVRSDSGLLRPVAVADGSSARGGLVREFLLRHPPTPGALHGPAWVMASGRSETSAEPWGLRDDAVWGEERWLGLSDLHGRVSTSVPLRARGRILGVLTMFPALPERAEAPADLALVEELGRRAAFAVDNAQLYYKAQESIRARDEFLSIASHELKTPLTSMRLRMQQMTRTLERRPEPPRLAEQVSGMLDVFDDQLRKLDHLVDHLLDVSRIQEHRLELRVEEFDLTEVVREVAGQLEGPLARSGCALEVETEGPVVGHWDRLRVEQVLRNLLTNAMKYGAGRPIHARVGWSGGKARLVIKDQGVGIPRDAQARIFERFGRAASRNYGGLGLGLFITRQIIEAHGGSIRVESAPGLGATFIVELPPRTPPEQGVGNGDAAPPPM